LSLSNPSEPITYPVTSAVRVVLTKRLMWRVANWLTADIANYWQTRLPVLTTCIDSLVETDQAAVALRQELKRLGERVQLISASRRRLPFINRMNWRVVYSALYTAVDSTTAALVRAENAMSKAPVIDKRLDSKHFYRQLRMIEHEFGPITFNRVAMSLEVKLPRVVLDDTLCNTPSVDLGEFVIALNLREMRRATTIDDPQYGNIVALHALQPAYMIEAQEIVDDYYANGGKFPQPHWLVHPVAYGAGGDICLGTGAAPAEKAMRRHDYFNLLLIVRQIIVEHDPAESSPYAQLWSWNTDEEPDEASSSSGPSYEECPTCGSDDEDREDVTCACGNDACSGCTGTCGKRNCNVIYCEGCSQSCNFCDRGPYCGAHISQCEDTDCGNYVCDSCIATCSSCNVSYCGGCVRSCSKCKAKLCGECRYACGNCANVACSECHVTCATCELNVCDDCRIVCEACDSIVCESCNVDCPCGTVTCKDCSKTCSSCDSVYCQNCNSECDFCHGQFCEACYYECSKCSQHGCPGCNPRCDSCDEHTCNSCRVRCESPGCSESVCEDCNKCSCGCTVCADCITSCTECGTETCSSCGSADALTELCLCPKCDAEAKATNSYCDRTLTAFVSNYTDDTPLIAATAGDAYDFNSTVATTAPVISNYRKAE